MSPTQYQNALDALKSAGYTGAVVEFSGGNDDGGVNHIVLINADGNEVARDYGFAYDNPLGKLLAEPVYDRYYSFAGEFYVEGRVTFDVAAGTVTLQGDEQVYDYVGFSEEV